MSQEKTNDTTVKKGVRGWPVLRPAEHPERLTEGKTLRRLPEYGGDRIFPEGFGCGGGEVRSRLAEALAEPMTSAWERHDDPLADR